MTVAVVGEADGRVHLGVVVRLVVQRLEDVDRFWNYALVFFKISQSVLSTLVTKE